MQLKALLVTILACVCTACGGGTTSLNPGQTGPGPIPPGATGPQLSITAANAQQAASEVLGAIDGAFSASDSAFNFGGAIGARIEPDTAPAARIALAMAQKARDAVLSSSGVVAVGVVITETQDCTLGGSTSTSIDTGSLSQVEFTNALQAGSIPAGTSVSFTMTDCAEPDQAPLNGTISVTFQQFSVDGEIGLDPFTIEFTATFEGLQSPEGTVDGDISFLLVSSAGMTDADVSGTQLQFASGTDSIELLDYLVSAVENTITQTETFDFSLDVSGLGQIDVQTLEPWITDLAALNPSSGKLQLVGADNTSVTITALDEMNAQLEVDWDGDGQPNLTAIVSWAELNTSDS